MSITREEFFDRIKLNSKEAIDNPLTYCQPTCHYLKRFDKHGHKSFFLSWNWAAFLLRVGECFLNCVSHEKSV